MRKRIIVLVELTEFSKRLLILAGSLAAKNGAEIAVVHQTISASPGMGDEKIRSEIGLQSRREALSRLAAFVAEASLNDISVKLHVTTSNLDTAIVNMKKSGLNDLIIVGIRGKNWLERILVGDTAMKLIDEIDRTVLAIPDLPGEPDLSTLHVAIKQKFPLNERAFTELIEAKNTTGQKVVLLSVLGSKEPVGPTEQYLEALGSRYSATVEISHQIIRADDSFLAIKKYMETNPGILVIQKGSRNLVDIFRKYFVNDVIYHGQIPIAVLPEKG